MDSDDPLYSYMQNTSNSPHDDEDPLAPLMTKSEANEITPAHEFYNELSRQAGLTARSLAQGLGNVVAVPSDIINSGLNAEENLASKIPLPFSKNDVKLPQLRTDMGQQLSNLLTNVGFPTPQTPIEKFVQDVGSNLTTAGATGGLSENPLLGATSIASGTAAADTAKGLNLSPPIQLAAGLAGGALPSTVTSGTNMLMNGIRGNPNNMANNISSFNSLGTTPSLGQATQNPNIQALESGLSKTVGSAPVMAKFAQQQGQNIGDTVDQLAASLSKNPTAENAGRSIINGVNNTFIPQVKATQQALYDKLDEFIPSNKPIDVSNTMNTLDRLTKPIEGAESLSKTSLINNPTLSTIKSAIKSDMGGSAPQASFILDETGSPMMSGGQAPTNTMSYQGIKQLRTAIGQKLQDTDLSPDVSKAQWKQLYGSLSSDMENAAKESGPQALQTFSRANNYTSAMHDRLDTLQSVIGDKDPEKVFQAAMSGTSEGATTLRSVMRSLPEDGQQMMAATVLKRMGRANPGNQNDVGDVFDTNKFLTNWNKISPEAKSALFGSQTPEFNETMNNLASVTNNLKQGSKVFVNPSGTAGAANLLDTGAEAGYAGGELLAGRPLRALALGATIPVRSGIANFLTNPKTVNALVNYQNLPSIFNASPINPQGYKNLLQQGVY